MMFVLTFLCEQTFLIMKQSKPDPRSWMTDEHLAAVLQIATWETRADFEKLIKELQELHFFTLISLSGDHNVRMFSSRYH